MKTNKKKGITLGLLLFFILVFGAPQKGFAFTVQFDQTRPGVQDIVNTYIRYAVQGQAVAPLLPPVFYMVTTRGEDDTVLVAKVGNPTKKPALMAMLKNLADPTPRKMRGPHKETIVYYPEPPPQTLSAYTLWGGWLFVAKNTGALISLLKNARTPESTVTPPQAFLADGLPAASGIRFWGDNQRGDLTTLVKTSQVELLIPALKNPAQVKRFSGSAQPGSDRKLAIQITVIPVGPRDIPSLKNDLTLAAESLRAWFMLFQAPFEAQVTAGKKNRLQMKATLEEYLKMGTGFAGLNVPQSEPGQ